MLFEITSLKLRFWCHHKIFWITYSLQNVFIANQSVACPLIDVIQFDSRSDIGTKYECVCFFKNKSWSQGGIILRTAPDTTENQTDTRVLQSTSVGGRLVCK